MLSKEEIETCKEEAKKYIEYMESAGDNAGWTKGIIFYIEKLEREKQELIEKLENKIKIVNKAYEELLTDIGEEKILYLTGLSKKEKDEKINKSNCLQVQKYCYEEILEMLKGKEERKKQNE